jgi:acetyl-CoA synthetase
LQCSLGKGNKKAIISIAVDGTVKEYTYKDCDLVSNKIANILFNIGFVEGDVLFTFLGRSFYQTCSFLGALKLKLITGTLFLNFGEDALFDRLKDSNAKGIITQKNQLKKILDIKSNLPALKYIIVIDEINSNLEHGILSLPELLDQSSDHFETSITSPYTPSVLHYTSGSTGKPKGVLHVHYSVVLQNYTTLNILSLKDDDLFWCTADPGWVTGTSYGIIGPMSIGITQIYFEGGYNPANWIKILAERKISVWYTAPTALRMLMQEDENIFDCYDFKNLKYVFSVGEPLNPEIQVWAKRTLKKDIFDTYFQTETGSIMISNRPELRIKSGSMGKPINKIQARIIDESGNETPDGKIGNLCFKEGWESMFITYLNNKDIYKSKFKNGFYYTGDNASKDDKGYYWFSGRVDDIINTAGHLIGPFEVESALLEMEEIIDTAVIAAPDDLLFEKIVAFIKLKEKINYDSDLDLRIKLFVNKKVSSMAIPKEIIVVDKIPKNKSGKIMRRYLRAKYEGRDPGDISTMDE